MEYNVIKIFLIASTDLKNRREDITKAAVSITARSIQQKDPLKNIVCIYSFDNTNSQEQQAYYYFISNVADAVIILIEDKLGKESYKEALLARETNVATNGKRPLVYGLVYDKIKNTQISVGDNDNRSIEALGKELLGDGKYFKNYNTRNFREIVNSMIEYQIIPNVLDKGFSEKNELISWNNDPFAFLTVEARFKENYKIVSDNFEAGEFDKYDKFEELCVYKSECKLTGNQIIEDELCRFLEDNDVVKSYSGTLRLKSFFRTVPFLLAEYYFYYYLLYLYHEKKMIYDRIEDPYRKYKLNHLNDGNGNRNFDALLREFKSIFTSTEPASLNKFLIGCLNMNSIDLSQCEVNTKEFKDSNMPINDCSAFCNFMRTQLMGENVQAESVVHVITDNSGFELMSDILFGTYLLKETTLKKVIYHIKRLPIFVSDTIMSDVVDAVAVLNNKLSDFTVFKKIEDRSDKQVYVSDSIQNKQLVFLIGDQWHRETLFKDMAVFDDWNSDDSCALVVVKGDLNYRRLVGDYNWKSTNSIKDKVSYVKKPLLIIRSLKSNVLLGVDDENKYSSIAPNWKSSGEFGIVQFVPI